MTESKTKEPSAVDKIRKRIDYDGKLGMIYGGIQVAFDVNLLTQLQGRQIPDALLIHLAFGSAIILFGYLIMKKAEKIIGTALTVFVAYSLFAYIPAFMAGSFPLRGGDIIWIFYLVELFRCYQELKKLQSQSGIPNN